MLRDNIIKRKKKHRQAIIIICLFMLLCVTSGIAIWFGMNERGIVLFLILFFIAGVLLDIGIDAQ